MRSKDSSGPDLRLKKGKDQDGWWDTSAEPGENPISKGFKKVKTNL